MTIRHSFLAAFAIAAMTTSSVFGQVTATWLGGAGNFTDDNWVDGDSNPYTPVAGDNIIIPAGIVTVDTDQSTDVGAYNQLQVASGTLDVTTGGNITFTDFVNLGTVSGQTATLIMQGDGVFSGGSFRWAQAAGSFADVTIRDTASFFTTSTQDIIGFSSALGSGRWTTIGSDVTLQSDDDIWIADDDTWVANITDATTYSTAFADDAFGFVGNGAVEVNVSGFAQTTGQTWRLIESGGETVQGPIANGFLPASFEVNGLDPGLGMRIFSEEVSDTLGILDVEIVNVVNLKINESTGEATLENPAAGALALDVDGYVITSTSGALIEGSFNGLADDGDAGWEPGLTRVGDTTTDLDNDGDVDGADFLLVQQTDPSLIPTWQEEYNGGGGQGPNQLAEANFDNSTVVAPGGSFSLGNIWDTAGQKDLSIRFTTTDGAELGGTVQYVPALAAGQIPEPTSLAIAALALAFGAAGRRRG